MTAKLPKRFERQNLGNLPVGMSAWTVPWAMKVDPSGDCWLNLRHSAEPRQFGTAAMLVTCKEDGYHVDVSRCLDHGWSPRPFDPSDHVPVQSLRGI